MSNLPINRMLDAVDWKPVHIEVKRAEPPVDDLPHVTHEGVLTIGGWSMRVYQLSNGQRVIDECDMKAFLGMNDVE